MNFPSFKFDRRSLLRSAGLLTACGILPHKAAVAAPAAGSAANIYTSLGVRPLINCQGVITIIGGSLTLPEVKTAMDEASRWYVHLDELADAVGKRLAELTGAEWGMVTAGCAAAMTHATSACIAGADPEKLQRLPDLTGLKNEVIAPRYCRNVYDHAVRMLGVKMIEVDNKEQLAAAFSPRTAMVYVQAPNKEFGLPVIAPIAKAHNVPVLIDCAAERLTVPNEHIKNGATLVAYSGGKLLRGPQCAGLLLGRKDLVQAAWYNSAPHHAFGRPMKVGKEEMMGMLAAVEAWTKRDHAAEWKQWQSWVEHIRASVAKVPGVTAEIFTPDTAVQPCPRLRIEWDGAKLGMTGLELQKALLDGDPRIVIGVGRGNRGEDMLSQVNILPVMMSPGDEKAVAERLYAVLSKPPRQAAAAPAGGPPAQVDGQWSAHLEFVAGSADHTFLFEQHGTDIRGTHKGFALSGDLHGFVEGDTIRFRTSQKYEGSFLNYQFTGHVSGDTIQGEVTEMSTITAGEYGRARWTAQRHRYTEPIGPALNHKA
jgi:L-seryl-tRNA(Ser) seleniumtransferase